MKNCVTSSKLMGHNNCVFYAIFLITILSTEALDLTIDNRLFVTPSDCYTRVSIGSRLTDSSVTSTIQVNSIVDCEAACSANGTSCGAFSFGVGVRGNGTCQLGQSAPQRQDALQRDANYDVYAKGRVSLIGCRSNQGVLRSIPSSPSASNQSTNNFGTSGASALSINGPGFGNATFSNIFRNSIFTQTQNGRGMPRNNSPFGSAFGSTSNDDLRLRTLDILQNKKGHPSHDNSGFIFNKASQYDAPLTRDTESFDYIGDLKNPWESQDDNTYELFGKRIKPPKDFNIFGVTNDVLKPEFTNYANDYYTSIINYPPEFGRKLNSPPDTSLEVTDGNWRLLSNGGDYSTTYFPSSSSDISSAEKACFRRLFAGKRIVDAYVRRAMECDRLQDCHRMCEHERGFTCEGFNYRPQSGRKSICELTSVPPNRVDTTRDFATDHRYDFYERDWNDRKCSHGNNRPRRPPSSYPPPAPPNWWNTDSQSNWNQPTNGQRVPPLRPAAPGNSPYGGTFEENTRLLIDIPRPIVPLQRKKPPTYNSDPWLRPDDTPLPVKPLEDFYTPRRQQRPYYRDQGFGHRDRVPQHGYDDRIEPKPAGYYGNGYSYGRPSNRWSGSSYNTKWPQRKIGHEPHPETNEIGYPYIPDHRVPPKSGSWDPHGHSYADGYHHTHYYGGPEPTQPPPPPPPLPPPPRDYHQHHHDAQPYPPPHEHDHFYGPFYSYGGGYGYSGAPATPPKIPPSGNQCSVRSAGGFRLARGIVRKSYLTVNLQQCESLCESQKDYTCKTFAYRYNLAATSPADNCILSDAVFENLVFYTDLEPDRDYDIYAMLGNPKWCKIQRKPATNPRRPRPPDECFWRVRTGFCMPPSAIKKPTRVDGMGECQVQCVTSRDFTCRSFVFRYETYPTNGVPNCFLSDWPAMEFDPNAMQDMDGAELYERGSFGRGCEPHHPISQPVPPALPAPNQSNHRPHAPDDASCYAGYDRPCKLTPYAIVLATQVDNEADCRRKCSIMRRQDPSSCMSFSYKIHNNQRSDNCYLSDIPTRDLRPGLDYTHDTDSLLYVWKELEPKCSYLDALSPNYPYPPNPPVYDHSIPSSVSGKPYARPDDPYYHEITLANPNKPSISTHSMADNSDWPGLTGERFFFPLIPDELSIFKRFTVSGYPCKRGTRCERNTVAGFWSCEPEGAEPGGWDYCCEPSHHCGFSQGYNYQWCYVGSSEDQWRPCSSKYYPYQFNPRPIAPPSHRPPYDKADDNDNYNSRHWPVTYLHGEAPPNGTDSIALANDVTNRMINDSTTIEPTQMMENIMNSSINHSKRRVIHSSLVNEQKRNIITALPVTDTDKLNRTVIKSNQRLNSRFKPVNTSVNYSSRFLRDNNNGQYFITKKLNAKLNSEPLNGERNTKVTGKIERISRSRLKNLQTNETMGERQFVAIATNKGPTTMKNIRIVVPRIGFGVFNRSNSDNVTEHWERVDTIDRDN